MDVAHNGIDGVGASTGNVLLDGASVFRPMEKQQWFLFNGGKFLTFLCKENNNNKKLVYFWGRAGRTSVEW